MVRPQLPTTGKRKAYQPKHLIKELVPSDSPWTELDWYNERSGKTRQIVEDIRESLDSAVQLFVDNGRKTIPLSESPKSVLDLKPETDSSHIDFDRGHVQFLRDSWVVFHPQWGRLLESDKKSSEPWHVKPLEVKNGQELSKAQRVYLVEKPPGLKEDELMNAVAVLKYTGEEKESGPLPLKVAAHHLKIADFQFLLAKARAEVSSRKGKTLKALKVEMPNGETTDLAPILQVIVDDEDGIMNVEDAVEVVDAMCSFASTLEPGWNTKKDKDEDSDDNDDDDDDESSNDNILPNGWTAEHETCGDVEQLFEGWEESNKLTAQSFVTLCLQDKDPVEGVSQRTAVREIYTPSPKRPRRKLLPTAI